MEYSGAERRRHHVYITRNTEYHLRDGVCVAVRDRHSRAFRPAHLALDLKVEGGVHIFPNGGMLPNLPHAGVGDSILFHHIGATGEQREIITSRIEKIDRPTRQDASSYPEQR